MLGVSVALTDNKKGLNVCGVEQRQCNQLGRKKTEGFIYNIYRRWLRQYNITEENMYNICKYRMEG